MAPDVHTVFVCLLLIYIKESFQGPHEKQLLNNLLATYNTLERPVANESEPLSLKFGLTLQQIIDVDEKNQILTTNAWLNLDEKNQLLITNIWLSLTPCCGKFYKCRYCHDENEDHHFDRKTLTELICTKCDTRQKVQAECENCNVRFGKYTCLICNLFDDEDKDQYHCHGCGICRIGGRNNFFHCEVCNMCLPVQLKIEGHKCVENISRSNCPVCLGDIHTSRIPCHIPDCGHLLHKMCFDQLLASGHYVCPTCQTSMIDMQKLWDYLDAQARNIPVPKSYENCNVNIFCNDCCKQSTAKFHFVGLKCSFCGGYNTSQNIKKRSWSLSKTKDNPSTSA